MSGQQKFYITTAISYPNGEPHIGHAYEAIATDVIARFERADGKDVFFLTGTDEHGLKMRQTAAKLDVSPRALADKNSARFREMVATLGLSNDDFIRTTEPRHYAASEEIWRRMEAQRRHLPEGVRRLVLGARRGLLQRDRDHRRRRRRAPRAAGHARRVDGGGDVFLPPVGLPGKAAGTLRSQPRFHPAAGAAQRGRQLRQGRAGRSLDLAHDARLGHSGAAERGARRRRWPSARDVRVGGCADELPHRRRLPGRERRRAGVSGRPTCTSSARTSPASTPSIGRHS